ncbi:MAG: 3-phosphoglycerate dehydrogenase [Candidatus Thorarchaeota archaeon]|nr:MAG: 3-phosphoglycerate dehydrogenase [Candidatus Thorarchaeota archaeon]
MDVKALITAPFSESGLKTLRDAGVTVVHQSWLETGKLYLGDSLTKPIKEAGADVVVVEGDEVKEEVIASTSLKLIGSARNDPNNISIPAATAKRIPVISAPGRNTNAVAEHTIGLILSVARKIVSCERFLKGDFFVNSFGDFARMYKTLAGFELYGRSVGIIGLGSIGFEVAKRLQAFGLRLLVYDPYVDNTRVRQVGAEVVKLDELLKRSDIVTIHCPPTPETKGMIGAKQFAQMKKTAIFINTARAMVADEAALLDALKSATIAGAGLDVFSMEPVDSDNVFLGLDNVVVTPHMGGNTIETMERQSAMIAADIVAFVRGKRPLHVLNPEVFERRGK